MVFNVQTLHIDPDSYNKLHTFKKKFIFVFLEIIGKNSHVFPKRIEYIYTIYSVLISNAISAT